MDTWKALCEDYRNTLWSTLDTLEDTVRELQEERDKNTRLRNALAFYANDESWDDEGRAGEWEGHENLDTIGVEYEFECDMGDRAKRALGL